MVHRDAFLLHILDAARAVGNKIFFFFKNQTKDIFLRICFFWKHDIFFFLIKHYYFLKKFLGITFTDNKLLYVSPDPIFSGIWLYGNGPQDTLMQNVIFRRLESMQTTSTWQALSTMVANLSENRVVTIPKEPLNEFNHQV